MQPIASMKKRSGEVNPFAGRRDRYNLQHQRVHCITEPKG